MKSNLTIMGESLFVGAVLIFLYFLVSIFHRTEFKSTWYLVGLAGVLFHLIFEKTGLNKYYVDNYYKTK